MMFAELHAVDSLLLESRKSRDGPLGRRRRCSSMFLAIRGTTRNMLVFAIIAPLGTIVPTSRADESSPEEFLRDQGLVRSGVAYIFKDEDNLRDRIAEIGRQLATWKEQQAGLDEQLDTLSRLRLQHQEILKKLRAFENGRRPGAKEYRRPPFPDDRPPGPGSMPPPPDFGPFQPGMGPPPPPPDGMGEFGPGTRDDFLRQLHLGDSRRQYSILHAERTARETDIVYKQVFCDDLARRLGRHLEEIERRRLEAVSLDQQIRAHYDKLASDPRVNQAIATLNKSSNPQVSLGPLQDYAKDLAEPAGAVAVARQGLLKRLAQVELKGMSRLTGLVGVAEMLLQEMGSSAGRMQTLEREAATRRHLLAEHAKQHTKPAESPLHATDSSERNQVATQQHANDGRGDALRAEEARFRESVGEVIQQFAAQREDYLRIVKGLTDAIDEADKERRTATNDAQTKKSIGGRSGGDQGSVQVASTEPFKSKLREFEKTIHTEAVPIDADKTIDWVDATLNGKSRNQMMVDLGVNEIRLSARLASEIGASPIPGELAVDIATIDGRNIQARLARLETVQVGPFTHHDVDCVVLPDSAGDFPPVLGSGFFDQFSTRIDADRGAILLTQVQVKPNFHPSKASSAKSAASSKNRKSGPAAATGGRSSAN
jgi:Aspartyl protease